jgi:predicted kinase
LGPHRDDPLSPVVRNDCPGLAIYVTSLNMRKWMRDRLQRRKKKTPEDAGKPAPPPLQPAYFDAEQSPPQAPAASNDAETPVAYEAQSESEPSPDLSESQPVEHPSESSPPAQPAANAGAQRGRGRRRRGGRGRGGPGRGREQAVAQAFTPAAVKGVIPAIPAQAGAEEAEVAEAGEEVPPAEAEQPKVPAAVPTAPARAPKGIVVLAIGLPGSGKSSWFKRHNVVPLSSDIVRSLLFDDIREQRFQDLVFSNLRSMLKARLIAKRPMNYVDATNLTPQERQHWIKLAKDYNYEVHAVFFDVPLEVCIERHQRRDRVVPEDVMRRMAAKLKPPGFPEGFAKITVVRVKKKEE